MKTKVTIEWDKPEEKQWLNPDNIKKALEAHCLNTKFKVTGIEKEILLTQANSQLIGFFFYKRGYNLQDLIITMELTVDKWEKIKKIYSPNLSREEIREIDEYVLID